MSNRLIADLGPLRESPAFRRLWAGTVLSSVGSALTAFAVILQVYDLTRSPLAVGGIGVAQMVPTLLIGLAGGSVTDAIDRRKLVLVTSGCLAAVSAAFAAQAFAGLGLVWLLYALVAVQSSLTAIDRPARATFVPGLLPASQLPAGLALNQVSFQITLVAGPALAGLIAAAPHLGLRACYLIDAISFAAALYGVARLPAMRPQAGAVRPGGRAVAEGVRFIRRSQVLAGAFLADLNATVFGLPVALFPAINAERFGGSPVILGLFMTAIGAGGLVSATFSGPVRHVSRHGRAMLCTVAVWGAAFAGFALAPTLWLTLSLLAVAGAADAFTVVFRGNDRRHGHPGPAPRPGHGRRLRRRRGRQPAGQPGSRRPGYLDLPHGQRAHRRPGHDRGHRRHRPGAASLHPVPPPATRTRPRGHAGPGGGVSSQLAPRWARCRRVRSFR